MLNNFIFFLSFTWAVIKGSSKASLLEILLKRFNKVNPVIEYVAPAPSPKKQGKTVNYLKEKRNLNAPVRKIKHKSMDGEERFLWLN